MSNEPQIPADDTRREALKKLGTYAAYTAPTMMVMLGSEKAMAKSGKGPKGNNGWGNGGGDGTNKGSDNGNKDQKDSKSGDWNR
jgi:hypothetical protein